MPRRKTSLLDKGKIIVGDMPSTGDVAAIEAAVQACGATHSLPQPLKNTLLFKLGETVAYAKIGLRPWLSGKKVKPDAWNLDIFIRGAFDAWLLAGLGPTVRDDATGKSQFLSFVEDLAKRLGILGARGSLFHNAVRARKIIIQR